MTLHGLEERRVHAQSREAKKGRAWNFTLRNRLWHRVYTFPLYHWAIRTADGAHTYSRDVWNMLQLKYNLDTDRTAYIPNGVEPRFFLPRRYDSSGPLKILMQARGSINGAFFIFAMRWNVLRRNYLV